MKGLEWLIAVGLALLTGCGNGQPTGQKENASDGQEERGERKEENGQTAADHYTMPAIPDNITTPEGRASYVARHYWERFPFGEKVDTTFAEQAFVDYVAVLPVADEKSRSEGVKRLFALLTAKHGSQPDDGFSLQETMDLAAHYLGNPESPMHNDDVYLSFLKAYVALPGIDEAEKTRPRFLIDNLQKNRVGQKATDFAFHDVQKGRKRHLSDVKGDYIVVYFNDPDCESCQAEMPVAFTMASLRQSRVSVLLVNTESERGVGMVSGQPLPPNWTDVYDPGQTITKRQLYYLPAMPSLYLLDSRGRILLKDATLQAIDEYLATAP